MTAVETYAALIDAVSAQHRRIHGQQPREDRFGGPVAQRFRADPHRSLDANLQVVASYVQPEDVFVDVGGGAGRVGLPLALRCRQVINVDSSPGMLAEFEACTAEAGITNARSVLADWLAAADISGDVSLASSVTYFVRDIGSFIEKMVVASRRRVMLPSGVCLRPTRVRRSFASSTGKSKRLPQGTGNCCRSCGRWASCRMCACSRTCP